MKGRFKFIMKAWFDTPSAIIMIIVWTILQTIYSWVSTKNTIFVSKSITNKNTDDIIMLVFLSLVLMVISLVSPYIKARANSTFFCNEYNKFMSVISKSDYTLFTKYSNSQINTSMEFIGYMKQYTMCILRMIIAAVSIIIIIVNVAEISVNLLIPVISLYVIGSIACKFIFSKFNVIDRDMRKSWKVRNQISDNLIAGFQESKTFDSGSRELSKIIHLNEISWYAVRRKGFIQSILYSAIDCIDYVGTILVVIYVVFFANVSTQDAIALTMLISRVINPVIQILDLVDSFSDGANNYTDYRTIIEWKHENNSGDIELSEFDDSIELDNISFSYGDSADILDGISMKIHKGEKIGICGSSGGGKSTIFKLLNRFYAPKSGSIRIDGIDINDITFHSYRSRIKSVHQENVLFPGSIKDNLLYGCPDATENEMIDACRKANILDFINNLPERFNTEIGPRGLKLSGGERQRIAIARVLITHPDILLLDEATSALDNVSEMLIQDSIEKLNCTVIMIAHRLSTIRNCDKIFVIGKTGIIESGSHEELIAKSGEYKKMIEQCKNMERK